MLLFVALLLVVPISHLLSQNITAVRIATSTQFVITHYNATTYISINEGKKWGIIITFIILSLIWIGMVCGYFYKKRLESKQKTKENEKEIEMSQLSDKFAINRIIDIMGCDFAVAQNAYNRQKKNEQFAINYLLEKQQRKLRNENDANDVVQLYKHKNLNDYEDPNDDLPDTMTNNMINIFSI